MISKRIIPCLDVKNGRVVKGVNFEGIQDVADPVEMAEFYNQSGADELVFYDITASVEGRKIFTDILTEEKWLSRLRITGIRNAAARRKTAREFIIRREIMRRLRARRNRRESRANRLISSEVDWLLWRRRVFL